MAHPLRGERPEEAENRKGFVVLPLRVLFDAALSPVDLRVLATIAAHDWGEKSSGCTLSYERIGSLSQTSESSVKRTIKKLVSLRYLFPPIAKAIGGRRYATVLRVTTRARETGVERPEAVPNTSESVDQLSFNGSNLDPSRKEERSRHGSSVNPSMREGWVQPEPGDGSKVTSIIDTVEEDQQQHDVVAQPKVFRPDVKRVPLQPEDVHRLRVLDSLGCPDSEDWLGLFLGLLAQREQSLGRETDAQRIRAAFDGAIAKRSVMRADNPLGFLMSGIERGFLLANPKDARRANGSNVDPSPFYALPIDERARLVVAVARGRAHNAGAEVVRFIQKLLAGSPGLAGRVEAGSLTELEA